MFRPPLPRWDPDGFAAPPVAYRGAPLWSWNGPLERERLFEQLRVFREMGMGGATIHVRTGLEIPYMGEAFLDLVKACTIEAERLGLLTWLYDEDRWPSGTAGGRVTQDPAFRLRHLLITAEPIPAGAVRDCPTHHGPPQPLAERTFVAAWALQLDRKGRILHTRRVSEHDAVAANETPWYAYREIPPAWSWFNHQQYADLLNPKAVRRFIEETHERYAAVLGDRFGTSIPSIFTDEPLFRGMSRPLHPFSRDDIRIAWTDTLPQTYAAAYNEELFDVFPDLLFDRVDKRAARTRFRFREHHTNCFVQAFAKQIGAWCAEHGIALTGHLMSEKSLRDQSNWVGDVMRSLHHFQVPGVDMLCDHRELLTLKQAQSIARQDGRTGVMSELYGVTNWDFPLWKHLSQGNWQAALGVNVRVHHLTWYSMAGEAKRDYPASIGAHVPWWREYRKIEDHFARVGVALNTGRPRCRIAIVHPIESFWVADGPRSTWGSTQTELEEGIANPLAWLLNGHLDVDLLSESVLPEQHPAAENGSLRVGCMRYDVVLVPPVLTLRSSTLDLLEALCASGGTVIWLGRLPELVDGIPSRRAIVLAGRCSTCPLSADVLLGRLAPYRDLEIRHPAGTLARGVMAQVRETDDGEWIVFVCRVDDARPLSGVTMRVEGRWQVESLRTQDGTCEGVAQYQDGETTCVHVDLPVAGHHLFRLRPSRSAPSRVRPGSDWTEIRRLADPVPVTLSEPNVLLLDRAAWRLDNGQWHPPENVLRIDNRARSACGIPERHGNMAQPWAEPIRPEHHRICLAFTITTEIPLSQVLLAGERLASSRIRLNGENVPATVVGWYVDRDIQSVRLPELAAGTHRLEIDWPFGGSAGIEACYLLGDFGVRVAGAHARIVPPVRTLAFDDWTRQDLPFYGGNVTYHCQIDHTEARLGISVPRFGAPLVAVDRNGTRLGEILAPPFRLELPPPDQETHTLDLTAFGSRINTFGALHNCRTSVQWWGPDAWRTHGEDWTDGYVLRPCGILSAPIVCARPTCENRCEKDNPT